MTPAFSVVYYSDTRNPPRVRAFCMAALRAAVEPLDGEIVAVDHAPIYPRCHADLYERIAVGIVRAAAPVVFMAEDDVLYPREHFEQLLPQAVGRVVRNASVVNLTAHGFVLCQDANYMSGYAGPTALFAALILAKQKELDRDGRVAWTEPPSDVARYEGPPIVDVRHGSNFTGGRNGAASSRVSGWPHAAVLLRGLELPCNTGEGDSDMAKGIIAAPALEHPEVKVATCCATPGKAYCNVNGTWLALLSVGFDCPHCRKHVGTVTSRPARHCEGCGARLADAPTSTYQWGFDDGIDAHLRSVVV